MIDDYTAGILPCQIDLEVTQIYTPCCYIIIPVLFNCLFKLTHSKVSVCVNMRLYVCLWRGVVGMVLVWQGIKRQNGLDWAAAALESTETAD